MADKKFRPKNNPKKAEVKPSGPFHFTGSQFHWIFITVIIALCFALYGNSIANGFSLDDEFVLKGDTTVQKGFTAIPTLFKSRYAWDQKGTYGYRPVVKASFAIESQFFHLSPHAGHVINILLYAIIVIFLFYFFRLILYDKVGDYFLFLFIVLFLSHPLHTEVVDSLKNRDAMLSLLFGFLSTYAFVRSHQTNDVVKKIAFIVLGIVSLNLGVLSKIDAVLFLAITPLVLYFAITSKVKEIALDMLYMIMGLAFIFVALKQVLPKSNYHRTLQYFENPLVGIHWYERLQLGFSSLWFYIHKLIFPKDLIAYYGFDAFHPFPKWSDAEVLAGIMVAGIFIWFLYKLVKQFYNNKFIMDIWLFALLLFLGTLFVFINVVKVGPGIVAERLVFIPSVGFALLLALLLFRAFKIPLTAEVKWKKYTNIYLVSLIVLFAYSARVIARNPDWMSHLSIYEHDAKEAPRSAKLQSLLGAGYVDEAKNPGLTNDEKLVLYHKAETAFLASIDIYPAYFTSYNNVGMIEYMYFRKPNDALPYFYKAFQYDSTYTDAIFNLASAYREIKDYPMSEKYFLKAIQINPAYDMAYIQLSKLYSMEGKYNEVLELNQNAIKQGHGSDAVYINIGKVYLQHADTEKAIKYFDTSLTYFSKNQQLCQWLANYYIRKKDTAKAQHYAQLKYNADKLEERLKNSR